MEIHECWVIDDPVAFEYIRHYEGWAGLQSIVRVKRERRWQDKIEQETAYYISSLPANAHMILQATRCHWSIENSLHWVMDVTFREDVMRIRKDNSSQNMVILRHIALTIPPKQFAISTYNG